MILATNSPSLNQAMVGEDLERLTTPLVSTVYSDINENGHEALQEKHEFTSNDGTSSRTMKGLRERIALFLDKSLLSYSLLLWNWRAFLLCFWFILAFPLGVIFANKFLEEVGTVNVYSIAPDNTPSKNATEAFSELYNKTATSYHSIYVFIEDIGEKDSYLNETMFDKYSIKYKAARDFVVDLEVWLRSSYLNITERDEHFDELTIRSYYHVEECCHTYALDQYTRSTTFYYDKTTENEHRKLQYMAIDFKCVDRDWFENLSVEVKAFCEEMNEPLDDSDIRVSAVSQALIREDTQNIYRNEIIYVLAIALPAFFVVYYYIIRQFSVICLIFFSGTTSLLTSMAMMLPVSRAIENDVQEMSCATPILMMCLQIALSRSYSMTIWSKFRDEQRINIGQPVTIIYQVLKSGGRTVIVSAAMLFSSISCLMFIPNVRILNDFGYGASVTIWITAACHLSLFPALLARVKLIQPKVLPESPDGINFSFSNDGVQQQGLPITSDDVNDSTRNDEVEDSPCYHMWNFIGVITSYYMITSIRAYEGSFLVFSMLILMAITSLYCVIPKARWFEMSLSAVLLIQYSDVVFRYMYFNEEEWERSRIAANIMYSFIVLLSYLTSVYEKQILPTLITLLLGFCGYITLMIYSLVDEGCHMETWPFILTATFFAMTSLFSIIALFSINQHYSFLQDIPVIWEQTRRQNLPTVVPESVPRLNLERSNDINEETPYAHTYKNGYEPIQANSIVAFNENLRTSPWYTFGRVITRKRPIMLAITAVLSCSVPVAIHSSLDSKEYNISPEGWLPDHSDFMAELDSIREYFGDNKLNRYKIIFDASNVEDGIITDSSFNTMQTVLDVFTQAYATSSLRSFTGIASLQGEPVSFVEYTEAISCVQDEYCQPNERQRTIVLLSKSLNNADSTATIAFAELIVDPYSSEGIDWLKSVRQAVDDLYGENMLNGVSVSILGEAAVQYDVADDLYDTFPFVFCIVFLVLFLLIGVMYDSFVHPVRSFLSTLLTLFFSYGLSCVVYDDDLNYVAPVMAFYVALGISLDTDTLLAVKIMDYRDEEFDDRSSVIVGLWSTGTSILTGGMIMVITFGSLLLTDEPALQQIGFFLLCSSVFDFFVIRLVVIPGLIAHPFFASWAWWPRTFRPMQKDISNL